MNFGTKPCSYEVNEKNCITILFKLHTLDSSQDKETSFGSVSFYKILVAVANPSLLLLII